MFEFEAEKETEADEPGGGDGGIEAGNVCLSAFEHGSCLATRRRLLFARSKSTDCLELSCISPDFDIAGEA